MLANCAVTFFFFNINLFFAVLGCKTQFYSVNSYNASFPDII